MKPTLLSLFSGIGGIDLAFERAGFQIVGQVEIDEFCNQVLAKHWPYVPRWGDIRTVRGEAVEARLRLREYAPAVDVIAGGFPCQDISLSGKRKGIKEGTRSGLWYEFARLIGELQPKCVFLENVANIVNEGGIQVISDLTALGYDCEWGIVPAAAVGAPHKRERWFCVAYANRIRRGEPPINGQSCYDQKRHISPCLRGESAEFYATVAGGETVAYSHSDGCNGQKSFRQGIRNVSAGSGETGSWELSQPRLGRTINGLSFRLDSNQFPSRPNEPQKEWEAPRTSQKHEANRIKALGNAVVPQVVYPFAVAIRELLCSTT